MSNGPAAQRVSSRRLPPARFARRTVAVAAVAAVVAAAGVPAVARADDGCRPSLDESVTVAAGTERPCGVWVVGHDVVVERDAEVDGGLFAAYGRAVVDGTVRGSVNVIGGDAAVDGRIAGDVYASGDVRVGAGARVGGRITGGRVDVDRRARVDGEVVELGAGWAGLSSGSGGSLQGIVRAALNVLVTVALAALFGALAAFSLPRLVGRLRNTAARPLGWSLLATMIGLGCLAAALALALAPWAPAALVWLVPIGLAAVGSLGVAARLGRRLAPRRRLAAQTALGLAALIAVIATLNQSGQLVLLCGGTMLLLVGSAWSIGVALLAMRQRTAPVEPPPAASAPPAAAPPPAAPPSAAPAPAPVLAPTEAPSAARVDGDAAPAHLEASGAPVESPPPPAPRAAEDADPLDLRRIPGITPVYAHLLRAGGIDSLAALAERTPDEIVDCLAVPDVIGIDRATAELWVAMARRRLGR